MTSQKIRKKFDQLLFSDDPESFLAEQELETLKSLADIILTNFGDVIHLSQKSIESTEVEKGKSISFVSKSLETLLASELFSGPSDFRIVDIARADTTPSKEGGKW